jgi:hypothetical protein
VLKSVQELIERNYVDNCPRHHLPAARNLEFEKGSSIFCVMDFAAFDDLSASEILAIARHRHIVVENVPQKNFSWDRKTLARLGNLTQLRQIQGMIALHSQEVLANLSYSCSGAMPRRCERGPAASRIAR